MRTIIGAAMLLAATLAAAQSQRDTSGCMRPTFLSTASCLDTRASRSAALCLAEIEENIRRIDEWELCVQGEMAKRQAQERHELAQNAQQRRMDILRNTQLFAK